MLGLVWSRSENVGASLRGRLTLERASANLLLMLVKGVRAPKVVSTPRAIDSLSSLYLACYNFILS